MTMTDTRDAAARALLSLLNRGRDPRLPVPTDDHDQALRVVDALTEHLLHRTGERGSA